MRKKSYERDRMNTEGAIYQINCSCSKCYVGQSSRPLNVRISEHHSDFERDTGAFTNHLEHDVDFDEVKILGVESNSKVREIQEALWIKKKGENAIENENIGLVNRSKGIQISPFWYHLIDSFQ